MLYDFTILSGHVNSLYLLNLIIMITEPSTVTFYLIVTPSFPVTLCVVFSPSFLVTLTLLVMQFIMIRQPSMVTSYLIVSPSFLVTLSVVFSPSFLDTSFLLVTQFNYDHITLYSHSLPHSHTLLYGNTILGFSGVTLSNVVTTPFESDVIQLTRRWLYPLTLTLKMTTGQVVEMSVTVNNNSPIQDYVHQDDQTQPTYEMTLGFKPLTNCPLLFTLCLECLFTSSCIATPSLLIITPSFVSSFFRCSQLITNIYVL